MADFTDVLVRWPKPVRGVDRVWWKPYTVHAAPTRWLRRQNDKAFVALDAFVKDVCRLDEVRLRAECKRAGLSVEGDQRELRDRLLDLVGVDPPENAGPAPAKPAPDAPISTPRGRQDLITDALEGDDYNRMRKVWSDLSDESIGRPTKPECVEALTAMLEDDDDGDE